MKLAELAVGDEVVMLSGRTGVKVIEFGRGLRPGKVLVKYMDGTYRWLGPQAIREVVKHNLTES